MRLGKQLHRNLSEIRNLRLHRLAHDRVVDRREVHAALVREVVKQVVHLQRARPALVAPENQVDPVVQVRAHVLALQRSAVDAHERLGRSVRPRRQLDVANNRSVLPLSELDAVAVLEALRQVEQLGDELFDVRVHLLAVAEGLRNRMKEPVRKVEATALQLDCERREGLHPDHIVQHAAHRAVVRPVDEGRVLRIVLHRLEALEEPLQARLVQRPDGLPEVTEYARIVKIDAVARVVCEHPGKHRVLRQVVVRPARGRVQQHQVFKVG